MGDIIAPVVLEPRTEANMDFVGKIKRTPSNQGETASPGTPANAEISAPRPVGYVSGRTSFGRNLWALHPNRTTRRLRKFVILWEQLGFFMSFSGATNEPTPATERAFLNVKTRVAHSVNFLRFIEGIGNINREAAQREVEFMGLLERFPSLQAVQNTSEPKKKELYYVWHSLYLFIHRVLGASPREVEGPTSVYRHTHLGEAELRASGMMSAGNRRPS